MLDYTLDDKVKVAFTVAQGRVVEFSLNYWAYVGGRWREVLRWDTAHGVLHRHRFWLAADEPDSTEPASDDHTLALDTAQQDLEANWRSYRSMMP